MSISLQQTPLASTLPLERGVSWVTLESGRLVVATTTYNTVLERRDVALGIAVARAPVGTTGVQVALAAGRLHLGEVEGAVHAAGQLGDVDVKGVLAAGELGHLVLLLGLVQEVDAGRLGLAVDEQRHG